MLFSEPDRSEAEVDGEAALRWIPGHGEETRRSRERRGIDSRCPCEAGGDGVSTATVTCAGVSENSEKHAEGRRDRRRLWKRYPVAVPEQETELALGRFHSRRRRARSATESTAEQL